MPVLRAKQTGDMYVQVAVETPQNLTKRQRELLAEFEKLSSDEPSRRRRVSSAGSREFLDGSGTSRQPFRVTRLDPSAARALPVTLYERARPLPDAARIAMPSHSARVAKKPLRLDDELQFIRSWIDKPLRPAR